MSDYKTFQEVIEHIGMDKEHSSQHIGSGRYPVGSGENPYQHETFYQSVKKLRESGMKDKEIWESMNMTKAEFTAAYSKAKDEYKIISYETAKKLRDEGMGYTEIGRQMGVNESTVRTWLKGTTAENAKKTSTVKDALLKEVDQGYFVDVSRGEEAWLNISKTRLDNAVKNAKEEGYTVFSVYEEQLGTGKKTRYNVIGPPDATWAEAQNAFKNGKLKNFAQPFEGDGEELAKPREPVRIAQSRIKVLYSEDGGSDRDGTIEIRRNVPDLNLGSSSYAQVRIGVDGDDGNKYYLKGVALYSDNIPDGYDIVVNSSKSKAKGFAGSVKAYKEDSSNPFGATIKPQDDYESEDGTKKQSAINKVREEGEWDIWSKSLASQFLSKQQPTLVSRQLDITKKQREAEFEDIMNVTNPTVKKQLLESFADDCDKAAVSLKAAAFPGQQTRLLLPVPSLKDTEIYAPHLPNGTEVIMVRYPHQGTFEIPRLTVNNQNLEGKAMLGNKPKDAVGINPHVAQQLSGADFDGDTALVIPTRNTGIVNKNIRSDEYKELLDFDNKASYPARPGMKLMGGAKRAEQLKKEGKYQGYEFKNGDKTDLQMGIISNLVTDMTLQGAPAEHIVRAVKHAYVIIDAEKHVLDYERSYKENRIAELQKLYQPKPEGVRDGGASTVISKSKGQASDSLRKERTNIDPKTGAKIYSYYKDDEPDPTTMTRKTYIGKDGKERTESSLYYEKDGKLIKSKAWYLKFNAKGEGQITERMSKLTKMEATDDANTLIGTKDEKEKMYADYANYMKDLGNRARLAYLNTEEIKKTSEAMKAYKPQYESLKAKLNESKKNDPRERMAQALGNYELDMLLQEHPEIREDKEKLGKEKDRLLKNARTTVGAKGVQIYIDDDEWEAIQNGAITVTTLREVVRRAKSERLKELATPRKSSSSLSDTQLALARAMLNGGNTSAEVAEYFNISSSTLIKLIDNQKGDEH